MCLTIFLLSGPHSIKLGDGRGERELKEALIKPRTSAVDGGFNPSVWVNSYVDTKVFNMFL